MSSRNRLAFVSAILVFGFLLISCSGGPKPPQPGTPAFYWAAAGEMYRAGDYIKTNENLGQITRTDNEFTARALPWEVVMSAGLAQAYSELADTYEAGARVAARSRNPAPFRRQVNIFRNAASAAAIQFAEAFHKLQHAENQETITLEFDFPRGSAGQPLELKKVSSGILVPDAELELLKRTMAQRGVLLAACGAVGAVEDAARALEIFKAGNPQVPVAAFRVHMASQLYEVTELFGPTKLDQPQRAKLLLREAMETVEEVPASRQTKELRGKVEGLVKKHKLTL